MNDEYKHRTILHIIIIIIKSNLRAKNWKLGTKTKTKKQNTESNNKIIITIMKQSLKLKENNQKITNKINDRHIINNV